MTIGVFVAIAFFVVCGFLAGFIVGHEYADRLWRSYLAERDRMKIRFRGPYDWTKDDEPVGRSQA